VRFRNDTGSVITVNDLGQKVGPFEEFDFPGYDKAAHGPVAGCTPLDSEAAQVSDLGWPSRGSRPGK
jgi:hypothetical protein